MGSIIRLSLLQTTVPLADRNVQRVSEFSELCDLEVKLVNLLVRKLRYLPAGCASGISHAQDFCEFL